LSAFYTMFCLCSIVIFTALRQWLVPAVADEPTTHVVPFYIYCVNCFINELVSCINK